MVKFRHPAIDAKRRSCLPFGVLLERIEVGFGWMRIGDGRWLLLGERVGGRRGIDSGHQAEQRETQAG